MKRKRNRTLGLDTLWTKFVLARKKARATGNTYISWKAALKIARECQ